MSARRPPRPLLLCWLGLLALLGLTVTLAYQPLGSFNTVVALAIAGIKATLVAVIFMELRERNALTIIFAGAGVFWLAIMFWLVLGDYTTRPEFPPHGILSGMAGDAGRGDALMLATTLTAPFSPR
jgi:cytochrome c oxidase subunit IV